jgi:hypothetical protein
VTAPHQPAHAAVPVEWTGGLLAALGALAYLVKLGRVLQRLDSLATEVQTLAAELRRDAELHRETATTLAVLVARVKRLEDAQ